MDGANQVSIVDQDGKIKIVNIKCPTEKIDGFSGHSDYNQLIRFVGKLRPKLRQVIINHGEQTKIANLASSISRIYRIKTYSTPCATIATCYAPPQTHVSPSKHKSLCIKIIKM